MEFEVGSKTLEKNLTTQMVNHEQDVVICTVGWSIFRKNMKPIKVFKVEITLTLTYSVVGWLIFEKLISMNCKSNIKCFSK